MVVKAAMPLTARLQAVAAMAGMARSALKAGRAESAIKVRSERTEATVEAEAQAEMPDLPGEQVRHQETLAMEATEVPEILLEQVDR